MPGRADDERDGVPLTNLDQPLFDGANATKRDLVDYLDGVRDRIIPALENRPLSVIRVHRGQEAFMQKNVPKYTPDWIRTVQWWAETSKREVSYALCNDRRTLLWFANQRAVEYHPTLVLADRPDHVTHLVLDLDPPRDDAFAMAVQAARAVRQALTEAGLEGAVKTSGAKGVHVFVPITTDTAIEDAAAATRAIAVQAERLDPAIATTAFMKEDREGKVFVDSTRAGGATVISAYSPRVRPGVPVSFPVSWDDLDDITPADFTVHTALGQLGARDPWAERMPAPQALPAALVEAGHAIPVGRVEAMHEGKRRAPKSPPVAEPVEATVRNMATKTVLITGAGSGFGKGASLALAARGHSVIATTETDAQAKELAAEAPQLTVEKLDITTSDVDKAREWDIDVLINNAGAGQTGPIADVPLDRVRHLFDVNVFGTLAMTQAVLPRMIAKGSGRIIIVSSIAGVMSGPAFGPYSMAKHALEAMGKAARAELAPQGVDVTLINPGPYLTGFNDRMADSMWEWFGEGSLNAPNTPMFEMMRDLVTGNQMDPAEVVARLVELTEAETTTENNFVPPEILQQMGGTGA